MYRENKIRTSVFLMLGCGFSFLSTLASAVEFDLNMTVASEWESNALQSQTNEQEDVGISYGLEFAMEQRQGHWGFVGGYEVTYTDYLDDLNEDETLLTGAADFIWQPKPGLFEWSFSYSRENEQRQILAPDTPNTRENRQVIATQPVLFFRVGRGGDQIITSARFVDVKQQIANDNDSQRYGVSIGWEHSLSQVSQFSINSEYSDVDFVAENADYELLRLFGSYSAQLRVLNYTIQLGASTIDQDAGDSVTAEYFRFEAGLTQMIHQWTLVLLDELTDTSIGVGDVNFALNIDNRNFQSVDVFDNADLIKQKQIQLFYEGNIFCRSCSFATNIGYIELDYENADRVEETLFAGVQLSYSFSQNLDLSFGINYEKGDVSGTDIGLIVGTNALTEEISYTVLLDWQVTRRLDVSVSFTHEKQETPDDIANDPAVLGLNFDNNIGLIALSYSIF